LKIKKKNLYTPLSVIKNLRKTTFRNFNQKKRSIDRVKSFVEEKPRNSPLAIIENLIRGDVLKTSIKNALVLSRKK